MRLDGGHRSKPSPYFEVLIRLSIDQGEPASVLHWYDQWQAAGTRYDFGYNRIETVVADAVSETHPDRAVELYCAEAEHLAAATNSKLYPQSVSLLEKARRVLKSQKREHEFATVLAAFQDRHHRKRRLVELLHRLEGRPNSGKRRAGR